MKKTVLSILACNLLCGALWAQTPVKKTHVVVFDFSETWCPPCGAYGVPVSDTLDDQMTAADKGYLIGVKSTSSPVSLNCYSSDSLASNFDITGVPTLVFNKASVNDGVTGNNAGDVLRMMNKVNAAIATDAEASAAANISISGNKVTVTAKTKFWTAATGQYYMTVLLAEDDISANQTNAATNPTIHHHVLRGTMSTTDTVLVTNPLGEQIGTSSIAANTEFSKTYKTNIDAGWVKANLEAYVIIFKMNGGKYEVVNAEKAKTASTTGLNNIEGMAKTTIYPNPATHSATLSITAIKQQAFDINITDMLGRSVYTVQNNKLVIGENNFNIPLNNINAGIYNVEISTNEGKIVQRLSVEK